MSGDSIQQERQNAAQRTLAEQCRHAAGLLARAQMDQPRHLSEDVDEAERAVVFLRDRLIGELRGAAGNAEAARWRAALTHVNGALSLVVGVEYPAGGVQRTLLGQAEGALQSLLGTELLAQAAGPAHDTEA
jgi:hypothetical protein